ncbi:MAG: putative tRNA sulfurtransferase [Nitrospirae bacterium]|nr:MAG: putative thiamine biosynthesis protein ThiI [Nitrospira sp. OLB3]MBV6468717.1 putative tRNA sulfurtransferase [Nitrospirota bacterium]MCE7964050.1 tRNA 4-thiouridine(8) synthase ThiI [Nitrospira sp. NTP2]MCK6492759.1 tRNA 4-thiouridine(8) synthase ThiI [Nitrospira sp.]MEB2337100.1 tRNA 4-thiouridine(8) synthase ThiI [Nitrospirales bacterium]
MYCAIVHYHELALKGRNRDFFEQRLVRNLRLALRDLTLRQIQAMQGRIRITIPKDVDPAQVADRLRRVCGLSNFLLTESVPLDLASPNLTPLKEAAVRQLAQETFQSFRVTAKRADKRLPLTSMDVEREIGAHVCAVTGKPVKLKQPDLTLHVELLTREAHVGARKINGPGGMPVGTSGKVACLISGGIDSPVAAYRMIKRGCKAVFVHFSGRPLVSRASEEKVQELVQLLTTYQYHARLFVVPFGEIQREIVAQAPSPFRVVLYRRLMVRITEELARREGCWALVTGDSLGQVASQTSENLSVIEAAAELPILRPLIGMDKIEITEQAQQLGTFTTSIEPDQDCCKLFVPLHPSTRTRLDDVLRIERGLEIGTLVKQGIERAEQSEFTFPA